MKKLPSAEREYVSGRVLDDVRGRMLEDIVLLETLEATPRPKDIFSGREVFKLQFESGEYDMVVRDLGTDTCAIYKVKHSSEAVDEQARHLRDGEKRMATEKAFGKVTSRTVLYRGTDAESPDGVVWRNINAYLRNLP